MRATIILLSFIGSLMIASAHAAIITLTPSDQSTVTGAPVDLQLGITGLSDGIAPSLGAYFVELAFDDTVLEFDTVTPSAFLGDTDPTAFETDIITESGPGFASIDVFSFLFDFELDSLQPADFLLASFSFLTLGPGTSAITVADFDLSTAAGSELVPNAFETASIRVAPPGSSPVPLPATWLLFGLGLLLAPITRNQRDY